VSWASVEQAVVIPTKQPEPVYEQLYPYLFVRKPPLLIPKSRKVCGMLSQRSCLDIEANLLYYKAEGEAILKKQPSE
jgi:hypothetical protein